MQCISHNSSLFDILLVDATGLGFNLIGACGAFAQVIPKNNDKHTMYVGPDNKVMIFDKDYTHTDELTITQENQFLLPKSFFEVLNGFGLEHLNIILKPWKGD